MGGIQEASKAHGPAMAPLLPHAWLRATLARSGVGRWDEVASLRHDEGSAAAFPFSIDQEAIVGGAAPGRSERRGGSMDHDKASKRKPV